VKLPTGSKRTGDEVNGLLVVRYLKLTGVDLRYQ
jgi:hypothetical protein